MPTKGFGNAGKVTHQQRIEASIARKKKVKFIRKINVIWQMRGATKAKTKMYDNAYLRKRLEEYGVDLLIVEEYFPDLYELLYPKKEKEQKDHDSELSSDTVDAPKQKSKKKKFKKTQE